MLKKSIAMFIILFTAIIFLKIALSQQTAVTEVGSNFYLAEGLKCVENNQAEEAIAQFKEAVKSDPENAYCYKLLGLAFFEIGNRVEGELNIRKAIELYKSEEENYQAEELGSYLEKSNIVEKDPSENLKLIQNAEKVSLIGNSYGYTPCNSTLDCNIKLDILLPVGVWKYQISTDEKGDYFCAQAQSARYSWLIREEGDPAKGVCE